MNLCRSIRRVGDGRFFRHGGVYGDRASGERSETF